MKRCRGSVAWHLQLLICALLLPSSTSLRSVPTEPTITLKKGLTSYDVRGSTLRELHSQMLSAGPKDLYGVRRYAKVHWQVSWNSRESTQHPGQEISINAKVEIALPHWADQDHATPELQTSWNSFMQKLLTHETNHLNNFERFLPQLQQALQLAANQKDATKQSIDTAGHKALRKVRAYDREYDQRTAHGKSEGIELTE